MNLIDIQKDAFENSSAHGFWDEGENQNIPTKLMLITTEVAEAMEEYRRYDWVTGVVRYTFDGKPESFGMELADIIIRVADLAEWLDLNLDSLVEEKMAFNKTRERMHGGKRV